MKVQKTYAGTIKAAGDRQITFIVSDELEDRDGDIIKISGWQLSNFRKNPVFQAHHDGRQAPIGRFIEIGPSGSRLIGTVKFADKGTNPQADLLYSMYKQGVMNAVSVSFYGLEWTPREDVYNGRIYTKQELLEVSAVNVPANPRALAVAKALGGGSRSLESLFEKDRQPLEALFK